jgi:hypothetical protein
MRIKKWHMCHFQPIELVHLGKRLQILDLHPTLSM